jgi:hypothetical protein
LSRVFSKRRSSGRIGRAFGQGLQRGGVGIEQRGVGILARQHLEQQFVEVVAQQQAAPAQQRHAAEPFDLGQGLDLAAAEPASSSGWKDISMPRMAERGRRAPRASRGTRPWSRLKTSTTRLVSL